MAQARFEALLQEIVDGVADLSAVVSGAGRGVTASASFTPAAAAYSAGDILDVAKQFSFVDSNGVAVPDASLIRILTTVVKIDVTSVPAGQTNYKLRMYNVTPPTVRVDNDAWTLASADLAAYRGLIDLGTPVDDGAALYVKQQYVDADIKLTTASLFGELQTVGGFTATAVARQVFLYGMVI